MQGTNLIILAAGNGTRNKMFTFDNVLPKCLLSIGDKTLLEGIIDSYENIVGRIYIVCQSAQKVVIDAILQYKRPELNYSFIEFDEQPGTVLTMKAIFTEANLGANYEAEQWFINWCDVLAESIKVFKSNAIILDSKYRHRNLGYVDTNKLQCIVSTGNSKGNLPGIFYGNGADISKAIGYATSADRLGCVNDLDVALNDSLTGFSFVELADVIDTGDYEKYTGMLLAQENLNVARFFNDIKIGKSEIEKKPITDYGIKLHDLELRYYRKFGRQADSICKLISYDIATKTMTLQKLGGGTAQSKLNDADYGQKTKVANSLIAKFDEAIKSIHSIDCESENERSTIDERNNAAYYEFVTMLDKRVVPLLPLIDSVIKKHNITSIDGMPITTDYAKLRKAVEAWISNHYNAFHWGIVHGDPNTDNCMFDKGDMKFIDPRGYFGDLDILGFGIKEYDYAKFIYGLTGYSKFNLAPFIATDVIDGDLQCYIGIKEDQGIADANLFEIELPEDNGYLECYQVLVGIIWCKLTTYIINNPQKSVLAYLYGNAILTKMLRIE